MIGIHNDTFGLRTTTAVGSRTLSTNTYDSNHNLSQRTYGNGNTVSYTYDNFGNASTVSYNNVVAVKNLSDASGNIVRTQDLRTNLEHLADYDSTGRLISKDVLDLSVSGTADKWLRSIEYDFDENNNLTKLAFASKSGSNVTTHSYKNEDNECKDNLPTVTTLQNGRKVTYTHDAYGRLTSKNLDTSNALVYNYTYMDSLRDGDYTTTKLLTESIGENKYRYTYDAYGNITNIFKVSGNTETILYTYYYDDYNQLTTAIDHENSEKTEYTYNQAGNLTRRKRYTIDYSLNPTATLENISYVYGDSTWKDLLTSYNGQTITYDAIGNPLNYRDGITLTWQNGRELASYSDANNNITYTYDASGMRIKKSIDVLGDVKYVYEGGLLLQMDYLGKIFDFSYDANGTPIGFRYNDNGAISYYYYGVNSHGDIVSIYNVAGGEVVQYTYDAYGKPLTTSATSAYTSIATINPLRYRGYVYDRETGLYYLQSRYYDPVTCRFVSADTTDILTATASAHTDKNLFAYCDNNPIVRVDDGGEFWHLVAGAVIGGIVGGVSAWLSGGDIADIAIGAIAGAGSGLLTASGAGVVVQMVAGAGIAMASNVAQQTNAIINKEQDTFDFRSMAFDGVVGGVCGALGGNGASYGNTAGIKSASKNLAKQVFKNGKNVGKAAAYYAKTAHNAGGEFVMKTLTKSLAINSTGSAIVTFKERLLEKRYG